MTKFKWSLLAVIALLIISVLIQSHAYIRTDTYWLMTLAERLLAGGSYTTSFLEMNPPMSIYLYILPTLLAKTAHLSFAVAARIYVYIIALASLYVCHLLLPKDKYSTYAALITTLAATYFIMPGFDFSQREHIAFMLIMPYYLLAAARLKPDFKISPLNSLFIGLFAGIGLCVKPHLFISMALTEMYLIYRKQKFIRGETIGIVTASVIYLITVVSVNRDFFTIAPYISDFFFAYFKHISLHPVNTLFFLLKMEKNTFIVATILTYFILKSVMKYKNNLGDIFFIETIGLFIFALCEPVFFDYHFIPAFYMSILLTIVIISAISNYSLGISKSFTYLSAAIFLYLPVTYLVLANKLIFDMKQDVTLNNYITFINTHPHAASTYFISTGCSSIMYTLIATHNKPDSRYECLWPPVTIAYLSQFSDQKYQNIVNRNRIFLRNSLVEDLVKAQPHYVFVRDHIGWMIAYHKYVNFIQLLSESTEFKKWWKQYKYVGMVNDHMVYERTSHPSS